MQVIPVVVVVAVVDTAPPLRKGGWDEQTESAKVQRMMVCVRDNNYNIMKS